MTETRFGIVGLGGIGQVRARALQRTPGCRLAFAADTDPQRADDAQTFGARIVSLEELLAAKDCDAVIVSTRPDTHAAIALAAIRAGKHVLIEKPMASAPADCAQIVAEAERFGVRVGCGFNFRFFAAFRAVKQAIAEGRIGALRHVVGYAGHTGLTELRSPWMYDRAVMGGGTLMDNGIHLIDMMNWLMGGVCKVTALESAPVWNVGVEETSFLQLQGQGGIVGTTQSSWTAWKGYRFAVEAYGDEGVAIAAYAPLYFRLIQVQRTPTFTRRSRTHLYPSTILREKLLGWQDTAIRAFVDEFSDFRHWITQGGQPGTLATGRDGQRAVEIADAAYRSVRERRPVDLTS